MNQNTRIVKCCSTFFLLVLHSLLWAQQIALTIDDAPWPNSQLYKGIERTHLLIQNLKEVNVRQVVFFVNGRFADSRRGIQRIQLYADAGHLIANHSYHHWDFNTTSMPNYTKDILKVERLISNIPNFIKWYRAPLNHEGNTREKRDQLNEFLKQHGYIKGYVTIDNWDFYIEHLLQKGLKKGRVFNKNNLKKLYLDQIWNAIIFYDGIAKQFISRPVKHTLLLHDFDITAMFIKDLVGLLRENGWVIISPEEAYTDTLLMTAPDVLLNNQGRIMAIAKSKGYKGPYRSGEDEHTIEKHFITYQVWEK